MQIRQHVSCDETVHWYMDEEGECCYIETAPIFSQYALELYLDAAAVCGYVPLDEDECEPELTAEGWTRIYLAQVVGIPMQAAPCPQEAILPTQRTGRAVRPRLPHGMALVAGLTGAAYVLADVVNTIGDVTTGGLVG